ncbi:unnamed protein product, partial [Symbiodinium microadriaticum]
HPILPARRDGSQRFRGCSGCGASEGAGKSLEGSGALPRLARGPGLQDRVVWASALQAPPGHLHAGEQGRFLRTNFLRTEDFGARLRMGRGNRWHAAAQSSYGEDWRSYSGTPRYQWSVWPGAWKSPRGNQQRPQKGDSKGKYQFPAYDEDRKDQHGIIEVAETRRPKASEPSLVQAVQTACNHARKLDGRVQKLQSDLLRKDKQWQAYLVDIRAAYKAEKQRHALAVKRIESELKEATIAQKEAHQRLGQFYVPSQAEPAGSADDQGDWDELMAGTEPAEVVAEGDLAAAMKVLHQHFGAAGAGAAPCTPPRRGSTIPAMTPSPATTAASRTGEPISPPHFGAPADPYPSPSPSGPPGPLPASPGPTSATPPPRPKAERRPIKRLPQAVPHSDSGAPTLSDKLQDKRQNLIAQKQAAEDAAKTDASLTGGGPPEISLIHDDEDDEFMEEPSPTGTHSPGLGRLE